MWRRGRKGNQMRGGITGSPFSWGILIQRPGRPCWRSLESVTVKCGHESAGLGPRIDWAGEWSTSGPGRFTHGERAPGTHWIGGWVDLRAGLDDLEKRKFLSLPGLELRPLGRPARS
jgi:hypothetical protein